MHAGRQAHTPTHTQSVSNVKPGNFIGPISHVVFFHRQRDYDLRSVFVVIVVCLCKRSISCASDFPFTKSINGSVMHRQINKPWHTQTGLQSPAVGCCVNSTTARVNRGAKGAKGAKA